MATEFKMPELGENVETGEVISVLVKEGDVVEAGQDVLEVEAAKAVEPLPAPQAGKVVKVHVSVGDEVPIGATLLTIEGGESEASSESASETASKPAKQTEQEAEEAAPAESKAEQVPQPVSEEKPQAAPAPAAVSAGSNGASTSQSAPPQESPSSGNGAGRDIPIAAGPSTRRLARELGIDLARVRGSGSGGRITREDVVAAVRELSKGGVAAARPTSSAEASHNAPPGDAGKDSFGTVRRTPLPKIRKTIATQMVRSVTTIPHVTNFDDADITELERIRKGGMADYANGSVKLTMMPFVMKAVAHALKLHPTLNASLDMEQQQIVYKEYVNLGVAVDTERGLVVPVVRSADRLSIPQIASELAEVAGRVREGKFSAADAQGGTFTISNLGAIGGAYSTPIINHPEVAILLVGRSRKLPVVIDDQVQPRLMMPMSLSYDHRLVDGATAARFLNEIISFLETPGRLLLAT